MRAEEIPQQAVQHADRQVDRLPEFARLRRTDVIAEGEALVVRVGEDWLRIATDDMNPVEVYANWVEVLGFLDRYPSTRLLAGRLDGSADLAAFADHARRDDRPLLTPIDRWGHTPFAPTALTGQSVAALVRAHLSGRVPVRKRPQPESQHRHSQPCQDRTSSTCSWIRTTTTAKSQPGGMPTFICEMSPTSSMASKTKPINYSLIY